MLWELVVVVVAAFASVFASVVAASDEGLWAVGIEVVSVVAVAVEARSCSWLCCINCCNWLAKMAADTGEPTITLDLRFFNGS